MVKGKPQCVEHLSGYFDAGFLFNPRALPFAVDFVPQQGIAEMLKVDPDLVGASGV